MNNKILLSFVALLLAITVVFHYGQPQTNVNADLTNTTMPKSAEVQGTVPSYQNINAEELKDWLASGEELFLIDVREPYEYNEGFIEGAINMPLGQLESRRSEIPLDKKVVVYCRSSRRSAEAANILVKNGYNQVFNLDSGIIKWPFGVVKQ